MIDDRYIGVASRREASDALIREAWDAGVLASADALFVDELRAWSGVPGLMLGGYRSARKPIERAVVVPWPELAARVELVAGPLGITAGTVALVAAWAHQAQPHVLSPLLAIARRGGSTYTLADIGPDESLTAAVGRLGPTLIVAMAGYRPLWSATPAPAAVSTVVIVGARPATDLERRLAQRWAPKADVVALYELHEAGPIAASRGAVPWGVVGQPLPGVEVDAVAADGRTSRMLRVRSPGAAGAFLASGASILAMDGWLNLGIPAHFDRAGRLMIETPRRVGDKAWLRGT